MCVAYVGLVLMMLTNEKNRRKTLRGTSEGCDTIELSLMQVAAILTLFHFQQFCLLPYNVLSVDDKRNFSVD